MAFRNPRAVGGAAGGGWLGEGDRVGRRGPDPDLLAADTLGTREEAAGMSAKEIVVGTLGALLGLAGGSCCGWCGGAGLAAGRCGSAGVF
jgi:hypothetical protein